MSYLSQKLTTNKKKGYPKSSLSIMVLNIFFKKIALFYEKIHDRGVFMVGEGAGAPSKMKNTIVKDCYFQHGYVLMLEVTENLSRH
jgi:hypothetical protein